MNPKGFLKFLFWIFILFLVVSGAFIYSAASAIFGESATAGEVETPESDEEVGVEDLPNEFPQNKNDLSFWPLNASNTS